VRPVDESLRILILEDSASDAELVLRELGQLDGAACSEVIMTGDDLRAQLESDHWDVIVSDFSMPGFDAMEALEITRETHPLLPFVVMSGTIGEERAVELLRSGVTDYVMKEHLGRLGSVVKRAVREAREHQALNEAQLGLMRSAQEWLDTFNALSDAVLMLDAEGSIRRINRAAPELLCTTPDKLLGSRVADVIRSICPDADRFLESWGVCPPARFEVGPCELPSVWFEVSCDPIDGNGHPATGHVLVLTDITQRKRSDAQLRSLFGRLKRTMDGTVAIAVRMVESRDPYTAGHQERVAELAVAIARRLHLDDDAVELIHTAARLHDVGKIAVPAEILVKPGQLQELEWELIKRHPVVGAEIIKDAEFEGPIHEIVLQHHERLDGSGYPLGLAGDAICREAQIVAVADVTEAMTAHRPYRPACTTDQVFAELSGGRTIRYAPDIVDACLDYLRQTETRPKD